MDEQEDKKVVKKILRFVNEWEATEYLKQDVVIHPLLRTILYKPNSLGLKKFGAIDYLVNYHKYYAARSS